jgi:uncharacterized protein YndB with AHSA1/START domain
MTETATKQLHLTRIFDAPRELVYQAFVDPDQIAEWFGPVGFSVPRESVDIDARIGGHQRFEMVDDSDPTNVSVVDARFQELVPNELIVGYQEVSGIPGHPEIARMTLRLEFHEEAGNRTRLELTQGPFSQEISDGARQGWTSQFTKLDALLKG